MIISECSSLNVAVVITVLNAYSGFALVAEGRHHFTYALRLKLTIIQLQGFMLDNPLLTTVGSLIGVSGSILSYIMCVAMNRSLTNVLFGGITAPTQSDYKIEGQITKTSVDEAVDALTNAENVILVRNTTIASMKF